MEFSNFPIRNEICLYTRTYNYIHYLFATTITTLHTRIKLLKLNYINMYLPMKPQLTFVSLNYKTWTERWSTSLFTYIKCAFQTYSDMIGECLNNYNYTLY